MGIYKEIFNSDDVKYAGKGNHIPNTLAIRYEDYISITSDIPPLSTVYLKNNQ